MYYRIDDVQTEESGLTYVTVSVWRDKAAFQHAERPDEVQDFRLGLPPANATDRVFRKRGQRYERTDGGLWTQNELDAEYVAYRRGQRTHPYADLAVDVVAVDHAALIEAEIEKYYALRTADGKWRGDDRDKSIRTRAARVEDVAEKAEVKALRGKEEEKP